MEDNISKLSGLMADEKQPCEGSMRRKTICHPLGYRMPQSEDQGTINGMPEGTRRSIPMHPRRGMQNNGPRLTAIVEKNIEIDEQTARISS